MWVIYLLIAAVVVASLAQLIHEARHAPLVDEDYERRDLP